MRTCFTQRLFWIGLTLAAATALGDLGMSNVTNETVQSLVASKDWSEAVFVARSVPVSDRGEPWQAAVEKAAIGHLSSLDREGSVDLDEVSFSLQETYPHLLLSAGFREIRHRVGVKSLGECLQHIEDKKVCVERAINFVKANMGDANLVKQVSSLLDSGFEAGGSLFIHRIDLTTSNARKICGRKVVKKAVLDALVAKSPVLRELGQQLASKECWAAIRNPLESSFERQPASRMGESACWVYSKRGYLLGDVREKCSSAFPHFFRSHQSDVSKPE